MPVLPAPVVVPPADAPRSFADLAAKANPAVVYVQTIQEQKGRTGRRRVVGEGLGSAFVFDPNGLILTNNHVIENATEISVTFEGKRRMTATVLGRDSKTDIAVLRVEAKGLPYLPLGNSDATRVGDWVVAIGNPFGLSHTVSAGIVSARGRTQRDVQGLGDPSGYFNFIQTDASINPGNSGGPLLDLAGQVVGINTAIRARANSIGFAVPINMVKELLPELVSVGRVRRSAIGIEILDLQPEDATRLGLPDTAGALVKGVIPGGPGDRAGLRVDDVILAFDGEPVEAPQRLRWRASLAGIGKQVLLRVLRGKRTFDLTVTLGELPDEPTAAEPDVEPEGGLP
ncbi:MAG: trypsin-like peptidase domain-containing protein [Polyangiaceae bacterium]|nr:trypsin-like peptidase domain-containing protein [Polyangiaceae bacterium]